MILNIVEFPVTLPRAHQISRCLCLQLTEKVRGFHNILKISYQLEVHLSQHFFPIATVLFERAISLNRCGKLKREVRNTCRFLSRFSGRTSKRFSAEQVPGCVKCFLLHAEKEYLLPHIVRSNPAMITVGEISFFCSPIEKFQSSRPLTILCASFSVWP